MSEQYERIVFRKDVEFIRKHLRFPIDKAIRAEQKAWKSADSIRLHLSVDGLAELIDQLGDLLCKLGVEDGEINGQGRYIEGLIDTLYSTPYMDETE